MSLSHFIDKALKTTLGHTQFKVTESLNRHLNEKGESGVRLRICCGVTENVRVLKKGLPVVPRHPGEAPAIPEKEDVLHLSLSSFSLLAFTVLNCSNLLSFAV